MNKERRTCPKNKNRTNKKLFVVFKFPYVTDCFLDLHVYFEIYLYSGGKVYILRT